MGHNVKYLISLKNRFWLNDNLSPESLSNGNVQVTWEATAGQEGDASAWMVAPGEVTTMGPILHNGIEDRLHFAGEYSCYKFADYMEGALNSGVTIARRLAVRDGVTIDSGG